MKDDDVGGAVVGDDLALEVVAQGGLDGDEAPNRQFLRCIAAVHGHALFFFLNFWSTSTTRAALNPLDPNSSLIGLLFKAHIQMQASWQYILVI